MKKSVCSYYSFIIFSLLFFLIMMISSSCNPIIYVSVGTNRVIQQGFVSNYSVTNEEEKSYSNFVITNEIYYLEIVTITNSVNSVLTNKAYDTNVIETTNFLNVEGLTDVEKPIVVLENLTNHQITGSSITVNGYAEDNNEIKRLYVSFDGGGFSEAQVSNVSSSKIRFSFQYGGLINGDHRISLYAVDKKLNRSLTNTVEFTVSNYIKWTVMVYMDGDNDLESQAVSDFNEMETGLYKALAGGNDDITNNLAVIVLIDRHSNYTSTATEEGGSDWSDTRLYRVLPETNRVSSLSGYFSSRRLDNGSHLTGYTNALGEMNMGDPETLSFLISYSKTYFKAENYVLILWNHGRGTRNSTISGNDSSLVSNPLKEVCDDDSSGDSLYLDEIQQVLTNHFSSEKLGVLGFDACLMGMLEVAYEFRNVSEYMVGSMHTELGYGWDYEIIFSELSNEKDEYRISSAGFAKHFVDAYSNHIETAFSGQNTGDTLSAVDLSKVSALKTAVDEMASNMVWKNETTNQNRLGSNFELKMREIRSNTVHFWRDTDEGYTLTDPDKNSERDSVIKPFYDLGDLCLGISQIELYDDIFVTNTNTVTNSALNVLDKLGETVYWAYGDDGNGQTAYYGPGTNVRRGLSIFYSRGDRSYLGTNHYEYQAWYTAVDTEEWYGHTNMLYGNIDFCDSVSNGTVETWRELMEFWYDYDGGKTPSGW